MATEKRLIDYYVVRNKNTGFYFRGKGANRWGEYHNQASIYRIRANAENTANWLNLRGEPVEIVPIRIIENPTVDAVEVVHGYTIIADKPQKVLLDRKCGICDQLMLATDNYCPMCGARNEGEKIGGLLFADMEEIIDA